MFVGLFLPHPTVVSQKYRPGNTDLTTLTLKRGSKGCSTSASALSHAGLRVSVSAFSLQFVLHAAHTLSCEYQPPTGFHRFSTYISVVLDDCSTVQMCERSVQFILTTCHKCAEWGLRSITCHFDMWFDFFLYVVFQLDNKTEAS